MSDERYKVKEITCETSPYYKWPPEWLIINSIPTIQHSLESTTSVSSDDNSDDVRETEIETINKKPTSKKSPEELPYIQIRTSQFTSSL